MEADGDEAEPAADPRCAACEEPIDPGLSECPACGNAPARKARWTAVGIMILGLGIGLVSFPVGVAVVVVGFLSWIGVRWAGYSPAEHDF